MEADPWPFSATERMLAEEEAAARRTIKELDSAESDENEFYILARAPLAYLILGAPIEAKEASLRALDLAEKFPANWNYGNAIHNANLALGLLAFEAGAIDLAKSHLEKAGTTPGSPQLASFGPNMRLAKRLLEAGETEAVNCYFDECARFWKHGGEWLRIWRRKVAGGEIPHFHMHLNV